MDVGAISAHKEIAILFIPAEIPDRVRMSFVLELKLFVEGGYLESLVGVVEVVAEPGHLYFVYVHDYNPPVFACTGEDACAVGTPESQVDVLCMVVEGVEPLLNVPHVVDVNSLLACCKQELGIEIVHVDLGWFIGQLWPQNQALTLSC